MSPKNALLLFVVLFTGSLFAAEPSVRSNDAAGFVSLFDGKTLKGWKAADMSWWSIEDGAISGKITKEKPCRKNQYLFSEVGEMKDFELKLVHRIISSHNVNCGFQYRSEHYKDADCKGYQIDNNLPNMIRLYDEFGRHTLAHRGQRTVFDQTGEKITTDIPAAKGEPWFKLTEWHEYHLICQGPKITLLVNGRLVGEVLDNDPKNQDLAGLFALQLHSGPPMTVQFKDIRYKPLKSGEKVTLPRVVAKPVAAATTDKTLVSWVAPANLSQRGGSALTIQNGDKFDAIVLGELQSKKWMAGSNFYSRTQKSQDKFPAETADSKTLVQMAIVYRDDQLTTYRNGVEYSSHQAKNIDLLSPKNNIAVFGIRHVGAGGGLFQGTIDDARIYPKALTADELKSLQPNKPSALKPYAWWDFEGDKVKDRAGRFPYSKMAGGAKLLDGKLVLAGNSVLVATTTEAGANVANSAKGSHSAAGPYVTETPAMPKEVPDNWLTYHLGHPGPGTGFPGDPNCAFYYKGLYHLHYIYRNKHGFAFAHVSSKDMVTWKWHPTVLVGPNTGHGMFSGTGFFTKEGKPAIIYHGQGSGRNHIAYALDDNLDKWTNPEPVLPTTVDGGEPKMRHWDPDCWLNGDTFYAISGGKDATLIKSKNLKDWTYLGLVLHDDMPKIGVDKKEDISCANMFKIGNKWMLLCISHRLGCRYYLGDFKDERYLPEFHAMMNWNGWDYFAPESLLTPDGRRVVWAWCRLNGAQTAIQALPRELSLPEDGVLRIKPLRELEKLRYDAADEGDIVVKADASNELTKLAGDTLELSVTFKASDAKEFGVVVFCDKDGNGFPITISPEGQNLAMGKIKPPLKLKSGEDVEMRIFLDKGMVEVFVNDRQAAVYMRPHDKEHVAIRLFSKGDDVRALVKGWQMRSIYE